MRKNLSWLAVSGLLSARFALGVPEGEVLAAWKGKLADFARDRRQTFTARDGKRLSYFYFPAPTDVAPQGTVVIVTGRAEAAIKYTELAYDLHPHGYAVYVLDWRGQGHSERLLPDPDPGYVVSFYDYAADLDDFVTKVPALLAAKPKFLIAHSMGACAVTPFLAAHPGMFRAAVLSAPMLGIDFGKMPAWVARTVVTGLDWIGRGKTYAPGTKPYSVDDKGEPQVLTSSAARFQMWRDLLREIPEIRLGGATSHWVREGIRAGKRALAVAPQIRTPVLVLKAEADRVVANEPFIGFVQSIPGAQIETFPGALHEIFMEQDGIRNVALEKTLGFFAAHR